MGEGGVSPDYFLDKMSFAEIRYFLEGLSMRNREAWEQARVLGYIIAQSNSTKELKQTDILRFPWDKEESEPQANIVSDADMERLRQKAKAIESTLKD